MACLYPSWSEGSTNQGPNREKLPRGLTIFGERPTSAHLVKRESAYNPPAPL